MSDSSLNYINHDGVPSTLQDCSMTIDKAGRYWLWSEQLESNLAFKAKNKEACLLEAIDSLLFILSLKEQRIESLQRIVTLAKDFADQVKPDEEQEY